MSTTDLLEGPTVTTNGHFDTGRLSFAKLKEPLPVDRLDLVAIQSASFGWLRDHGLQEIFDEISPIEDFTGQMALSFSDHRFESPKHSVDECKEKDLTYAAPLFVTAEFVNRSTGEIKSQTVFMGDFPVMTDGGTFIINGTERVVVSQLVRSPGVYFDTAIDKATGRDVFGCTSPPATVASLPADGEPSPLRQLWLGLCIARAFRSAVPTSSNRDLVAVISLRHAEATAARAWSTSSRLPFSPPFWCRSPSGTSIRPASLTPPTFTGSNPAAVMSRSIVAAAPSSSVA